MCILDSHADINNGCGLGFKIPYIQQIVRFDLPLSQTANNQAFYFFKKQKMI